MSCTSNILFYRGDFREAYVPYRIPVEDESHRIAADGGSRGEEMEEKEDEDNV